MLIREDLFERIAKRLDNLEKKAHEIARYVLVEGKPCSDAAIKYGVSRQRVSNILFRFREEWERKPSDRIEVKILSAMADESPQWKNKIFTALQPLGLFED